MAPRRSGPALRAACESAVKAAAPHAAIAPRAATPTDDDGAGRAHAHRARTLLDEVARELADCAPGADGDEDLVRVEDPERILDREQRVVVADAAPRAYAARRKDRQVPAQACSAARRGRSSDVQRSSRPQRRARRRAPRGAVLSVEVDHIACGRGVGVERLVRDDEQAVGGRNVSGWVGMEASSLGGGPIGGSCTERAPGRDWERPVRRLWPFGEASGGGVGGEREGDGERRPLAGHATTPRRCRRAPRRPRRRSRGRGRRRRSPGRATDRRGRSARRRARDAPRRARARSPRPSISAVPFRASRRPTPASPGGVWARTFASRLSTIWRSRSRSPTTTAALGVELDRPFRVDGLRGLDRLADDLVEPNGLALERPAVVEAREQQEILDEQAHALRLAADSPHRALEVVRPLGRAAVVELRVRPDRRRAASAARARRRRRSVAACAPTPPARGTTPRSGRASRSARGRGGRPPFARPRARPVRERSPAAIADAVPPISSSGRRPSRTSQRPSAMIAAEHDGGHDELDQESRSSVEVDVRERGGEDEHRRSSSAIDARTRYSPPPLLARDREVA